MASIAARLVEQGVRKLVIAGGETAGAVVNALAFLFLPLMFMVVLRREWLAFGLLFVILTSFSLASFAGVQIIQLILGAAYSAIVILIVTRFGLLAMAAAMA